MTDSPRVIRTMSQKGEGFTVRRARDSSTMINERPSARSERTAVRLERQWRELCSQYLPMAVAGSLWRYHRAHSREQPSNGWKIHVSATVLNAGRVLQKV